MNRFFRESFLPVLLLLATILVVLVAVYFKAAFDANQVTVIIIDKAPVVEASRNDDNQAEDEDFDGDALLSRHNLSSQGDNAAGPLLEGDETEQARQIAALLAKPETSDTLGDLAVLYYLKGEKRTALSYMNRAIDLEPTFAQEYFYRGVIQSSMSRYRKAIEDYRAALALNPNHFESTYNMGLALSRTGQLEPALETFIQASGRAASQRKAKAFYNAGLVATKLDRSHEAEDLFNQAIRHYPEYLKPRLALAALEPDTDQGFRRALSLYQQAIALQPDHAPTYLRLGRLHASRDDFKPAADAFRKAIQYRPGYRTARYHFGLACLQTGDFSEALKQFHWLVERKPRYAHYHFNLGRAAAAAGKHNEALTHFASALELRQGQYAEVHFNLGLLEVSRKNDRAAAKAYLKTIEQNPEWPEAHYNLGLVYLRQQNIEKAEKAFREATNHNPRYPQAWFNLGIVYTRWDKRDQAIDSYRKALAIRPDYPEARLNLAVRYARAGRYSDAIPQYRQLLEQDETYALAWYNLGLAYLKTGEMHLAEKAFRKNLALEPENLSTLKKLGEALIDQSNFSEAIAVLERAVNADASDPGLRVKLADLHRRSGDTTRARQELEKALRLAPDHGEIKELLAALPSSQ